MYKQQGILQRTFGYNEHSRPFLRYGTYLAIVLGSGALVLSCSSDEQDPEPVPTTTTTTTTTVPSTTTTVPPTTTLPPPETYQFNIAGTNYDCIVADEPHQVIEGDHIWKIVDEQQVPDNMPQRWIGTITLNQAKGTVGIDPNLIYVENEIFLLVDCSTT